MYTLRRQLDGEDMVLGNYTTYEAAAADDAVPGHPDEWVWLDDQGVWFHGYADDGSSFTVTPGPADPHP